MKPKKVIEELKTQLEPFLPFWDEWTSSDYCDLSDDDIYVIDVHIKNKFSISIFESFMFFNQVKVIENVIQKLKCALYNFKIWLSTEFLFALMKILRDNNQNPYLHELPIEYIPIDFELKIKIKHFKVKTLKEFFSKFNEDDFLKDEMFKRVVGFVCAFKNLTPEKPM